MGEPEEKKPPKHVHRVDHALHEYLQEQGRRLATRSEVVQHGGTDSLIRDRILQERWRTVQPAVYLVGLPPLTSDEERLAIHLAVPQPAGFSQLCSFVLWGLDGISMAPNEITVPHTTHVAITGATVHRSRCSEGFVDKGDIVVTSVERTLLESAPRLPRIVVEKGFTSAWRRGLTTPEKVLAYVDEFGSPWRKGTALLRSIAALYADGHRAPGSDGEVALLDLLRPALDDARIEHPVRQFELPLPDGTSATLDTAWPLRRKAIEPAGVNWHGNTTAQAYDYRRRALAREVGWEIEPVAPFALHDRPRETIGMLIRFLLAPPIPIERVSFPRRTA